MEGHAWVAESSRFYLAERPRDLDLDVAPSHRHTAVSVGQWKRPQEAGRPDAADRQVVRQGKVRGGCGLRVAVQEVELKQGCIHRRVEIVARGLSPCAHREERYDRYNEAQWRPFQRQRPPAFTLSE